MFHTAATYLSGRTGRLCMIAPIVLLCMPLLPFSAACAQPGQDIKEAVRLVLKENPNLVLDILQENSELVLEVAQRGDLLRKRRALLAQWEQDAKVPKNINLAGRSFRGNSKAPVTITAYSDFTCPFCLRAEQVIAQLLEKYDGKLRVTFKALPKDNDSYSLAAAQYATAAFMIDPVKGWEFFDALFNNMALFERDTENFLRDTAARLGYDLKRIKAEAGSPAVQQRLAADRQEADNLGISGTPYFVVNDLMVRGAIARDLFEEAVLKALELKKAK
jgi:predicted DsbA family dithiol-disulfide isomerase